MDSKEFLDSLVDKSVKISFKSCTALIGTLVWNDLDSVGIKFIPDKGSYIKERIVLYYKSSIESIESAEKFK